MDKICVSVIIPVYNIERHLRQCLDSILAQTLEAIEIICIDDGSTDQSSKILENYADRDQRIHVVRQENAGPGAARNRGINLVHGKYLIFLDSDDWFEPDFLFAMFEYAEREAADITICCADEFDKLTGQVFDGSWMLKKDFLPKSSFVPEDVSLHIFQFTYGMAWDKLYRTDFVKRNKLAFPELWNSEDLVFVYQSILLAGRITVLYRLFVHHRVNRLESVSNSRAKNPDDAFVAFAYMRQFLIDNGLMDTYRQSFVNWSMEFLIWHVANMGDVGIQKQYHRLLREKWFPTLNFASYPRRYIVSRTLYLKYMLIRFSPFWFFRGVLIIYKAIKKYGK